MRSSSRNKTATKEVKTVEQPSRLLERVIEARERWEEIIEEKALDQKIYRDPHKKRAQPKTLYLIRPQKPWSTELWKEITDFKKEIESAKKHKVSRKLWLPVIITKAEFITVRIYPAKSYKKVPYESARKFAIKAGLDSKSLSKMSKDAVYQIISTTGRKYKISVDTSEGTKKYPFTEWAICICHGGIKPSIKRVIVKDRRKEQDFENAICSHKNSILLVK